MDGNEHDHGNFHFFIYFFTTFDVGHTPLYLYVSIRTIVPGNKYTTVLSPLQNLLPPRQGKLLVIGDGSGGPETRRHRKKRARLSCGWFAMLGHIPVRGAGGAEDER